MGKGAVLTNEESNAFKKKISSRMESILGVDQCDDVLSEYIIVMIQNGKTPKEIGDALSDLISEEKSAEFSEWLSTRKELGFSAPPAVVESSPSVKAPLQRERSGSGGGSKGGSSNKTKTAEKSSSKSDRRSSSTKTHTHTQNNTEKTSEVKAQVPTQAPPPPSPKASRPVKSMIVSMGAPAAPAVHASPRDKEHKEEPKGRRTLTSNAKLDASDARIDINNARLASKKETASVSADVEHRLGPAPPARLERKRSRTVPGGSGGIKMLASAVQSSLQSLGVKRRNSSIDSTHADSPRTTAAAVERGNGDRHESIKRRRKGAGNGQLMERIQERRASHVADRHNARVRHNEYDDVESSQEQDEQEEEEEQPDMDAEDDVGSNSGVGYTIDTTPNGWSGAHNLPPLSMAHEDVEYTSYVAGSPVVGTPSQAATFAEAAAMPQTLLQSYAELLRTPEYQALTEAAMLARAQQEQQQQQSTAFLHAQLHTELQASRPSKPHSAVPTWGAPPAPRGPGRGYHAGPVSPGYRGRGFARGGRGRGRAAPGYEMPVKKWNTWTAPAPVKSPHMKWVASQANADGSSESSKAVEGAKDGNVEANNAVHNNFGEQNINHISGRSSRDPAAKVMMGVLSCPR